MIAFCQVKEEEVKPDTSTGLRQVLLLVLQQGVVEPLTETLLYSADEPHILL